MGQKSRACHPALDGTARCFRLHDLVTARTGQLRPSLPDHFEMFRYILQHFRNIFTELFQLSAAVWAYFLLRQNPVRLTRQMRRQRLPRTFRRSIHDRHSHRVGEAASCCARLASSSSSFNSNCSICQSSFSDLRPNCIRRSLAISSFSRSISSSREASCASLRRSCSSLERSCSSLERICACCAMIKAFNASWFSVSRSGRAARSLILRAVCQATKFVANQLLIILL